MDPIFFTTPRMIFRKFEIDDLDSLAEISSEEEGSRYVGDGKPLSRELTELWITRSRLNVDVFGYGTGAVTEKSTGRLIGWAGFSRPKDQEEEIIYGLAQSRWGKGFGSELLAGLVIYARDQLKHEELRATVDPKNVASIRMLLKQNFKLSDDRYLGDPESHLYTMRIEQASPTVYKT